MVTKNIVKQPKAIIEVQITVPWQDIDSRYNETLNKLAAEVEIPGFRKGQAPINMVEPKIAAQVQQEVIKLVMPQALIEALQGTNIVPIDYPRYEVQTFAKGQGLNFKATVTERPAVKVGDYKVIKVTRPVLKIIDTAEVNKVINDLFRRWKARQPVQQPTQSPQPSPSMQDPNNPSQAGSMQFTPSNNPPQAALPPEDIPNEPNDVFAKTVGAQSLEDLKTKIKTDLENEAKYNNELDYEELILQEVEKITEVDIPEVLVQDELNRMLVSLQRRVADMGLLLDDYLKGQGKTVEQLRQEWRIQAEKNVRMELGLSEIARQENVNIADVELQAEIDKIQDNKVKQQFENQEPRMHLRHALRQTKTLNTLKGLVGG